MAELDEQLSLVSSAKKQGKSREQVPLLLEYTLGELPSAQHRAGLAGLVLMIRWLEQKTSKRKGVCRIVKLETQCATFEIDDDGMEALFDEVYAAAGELKASKQQYKDRSGAVKAPTKIEEREERDPKTGKVKKQTYYYYPVVVPRGAFLEHWDPSEGNEGGLWIKLWRDMVWSIFRGVPATRRPFEARANKAPTDDAAKALKGLRKKKGKSVPLPSTYYLGAQAKTAENVPFQDRQRYLFLLHFWPFVAEVYVPSMVDGDGKRKFDGYALVVPDVIDLDFFCEDVEALARGRSTDKLAYLPKDAVVDVAIEGALKLFARLVDRVQSRKASLRLSDLVSALEVIHVRKDGNNVRILGVDRLEPRDALIANYLILADTFWDPLFRRQRLLNLVVDRPWHAGFGRLLSTAPLERFFPPPTKKTKTFKHDARVSFKEYEVNMDQNADMTIEPGLEQTDNQDSESTVEPAAGQGHGKGVPASIEALIFRMVGTYLGRKLKMKNPDLEWSKVKDDPGKKKKYADTREKLARAAFLAIRSRTGAEFIAYFTDTLCSVKHWMGEETYMMLSRELMDPDKTDRVRTLTLLALSARG